MKPKIYLYQVARVGAGFLPRAVNQSRHRLPYLRQRAFLTVLWLATLFVHSSCSEDEPGSTDGGSVKLRLSLAGISDAVESDTRSALAASKTEKFYYTNPDDETLTELTIEELPPSSTRSVQDMPTGTYVRVYVYKQSDGSYVTDGILKAGSSSDFVAVEPGVAYHVKAVSYNSTTSGDVPGSVTANMSPASLTNLSADKDVLYAEKDIPSGTAGSIIDIDLIFSHKFSLVRIVADNSANTTGIITDCLATLDHRYKASLSLTNGALSAGTSDGTHTFTWTSPNATAVTSNSATVYTGGVTTGHVLSFTRIKVGSNTYLNTSVSFNKAFDPGKTYRLTVQFKGAIPVIPTNGGVYILGASYVGAFWKASQTGERLIRIPVGTVEGNLGNWSAVVAYADERWPGNTPADRLKNIVLDTNESADLGIKWNSSETPADMNDPYMDALYQVEGNATGVGGTVGSGDTIKFRIGLKQPYTVHPYAATDEFPARYAVVVVIYGGTYAKTFNLYLRQGEDPDYVWSPSESYSYESTTYQRSSAVRFSPYNLTDLDGGAPTNVIIGGVPDVGLAINGATFTDYPTQAGYFFRFNYSRQAFHPVSPITAITDWSGYQRGSEYWNPTETELCPLGWALASGSSANFRRPTAGVNTVHNPTTDIMNNEMRQSLLYDPSFSSLTSMGSVWGFYADGFFDRRSHTHAAYGENSEANTAVSILTKDVAYIGRLFYNQSSKRSLFFLLRGTATALVVCSTSPDTVGTTGRRRPATRIPV
ncbi:MAG: hypothetical protein LBS46_03225 [Dysgonamonadaceae bacterium]|jgi:hypothetical protein|nr:hypothetical protein [Dysgonamonadaceae bacterium]